MINPIYDLYFIPPVLGSKGVSRLFTVLSLLTVLLLHGCTSNVVTDSTPDQPTDKVVWADDGSEVAVVTFSKNGDTSHFKHQISLQNLDGSKRRTITQWRDYRVGHIFYMKQAGYLVVESLLEKGARRFDKIALNGNEIMIVETPESQQQGCDEALLSDSKAAHSSLPAQVRQSVIPSPDGWMLAHIYSPGCGKVAIEFSYANNLVLIDTQVMDIDEPMKAIWHPQGYVILANSGNDKAWKITASAPPEPMTVPKCLSPVTTSSQVSLDGKKVFFDGEQLVTKDVGREKAFGCQH